MKRPLRPLGAISAAVTIAAVMSGCASVQANYTIHPNATVSGKLSEAVQLTHTKGMAVTPPTPPKRLPSSAKVVKFHNQNTEGFVVTFNNTSLAQLAQMGQSGNSGSAGSSSAQAEPGLTHSDGKFMLYLPAQKSSNSSLSPAILESELKLTESVTFPGPIVSHSGPVQVKGDTVSLNLSDMLTGKAITVVAK